MGKSLPISPWDITASKPPLLASVGKQNFLLKSGYCKIGSVSNFGSKALLPFISVAWGAAQIRRDEEYCVKVPQRQHVLHQCVQ